MTLGDVTEKGSMVSKMPCPPCRPFHPIGEAGLWMSAIWIQGGGAPLSWGGAHQTLFLFPERGLRESGTAAWAHYPRADSGLLGRCDTDVTVTARGTELHRFASSSRSCTTSGNSVQPRWSSRFCRASHN